jgi:protein gp37
MNQQKPPKGIEWTRVKRIIDGALVQLPGYTWNPTGGCLHGCTWKMPDGSVTECYAKTVAERLAVHTYSGGFEQHYWRPEALKEPLRLKTPAGIFVGSMADLFGHWVPEEQIRQVMDVMTQADWHTFQTLSKYPVRLPEFNPFPQNVWVGVSLPAGHLMKPEGGARALKAYLRHMDNIEAKVRFMSIEPLWFEVAPVLEDWLKTHDRLPFEWVIIGAASAGKKIFQPKQEWVQGLLDIFDAQQIPVFFKGNLVWDDWREEFPLIQVSPNLDQDFLAPQNLVESIKIMEVG